MEPLLDGEHSHVTDATDRKCIRQFTEHAIHDSAVLSSGFCWIQLEWQRSDSTAVQLEC